MSLRYIARQNRSIFLQQKRFQSPASKFIESIKKQTVEDPKVKKAFDNIKKTTAEGQEAGKEGFEKLKNKFKETYDSASKGAEEAANTAKEQASIDKNPVWKNVTETVGKYFEQTSKTLGSMFGKAPGAKPSAAPKAADESAQSLLGTQYAYGGITPKEYRNKIKAQRLGTAANSSEDSKDSTQKEKSVEENPDAGANVVLHKDSRWKEAWDNFKDNNPIVQGVFTMRRNFEESDNVFVNSARVITDRVRDMLSPVFEESEHAQAIAEIKTLDPSFELEEFLKEAREFMVPEVLEAYVHWQPKDLKEWCSDAVFNVLEASREPIVREGLTIEGKILDLRHVDLVMAKMMEDVPLLILTFKTQQTEVVKKANGEIVSGSEEKINDVFYIWALTKDPERPNPLTKGWKIAEFAIQGVRESF